MIYGYVMAEFAGTLTITGSKLSATSWLHRRMCL